MSSSNWLVVEFFSDSSQAHKGFKARYWLEGRLCDLTTFNAQKLKFSVKCLFNIYEHI